MLSLRYTLALLCCRFHQAFIKPSNISKKKSKSKVKLIVTAVVIDIHSIVFFGHTSFIPYMCEFFAAVERKFVKIQNTPSIRHTTVKPQIVKNEENVMVQREVHEVEEINVIQDQNTPKVSKFSDKCVTSHNISPIHRLYTVIHMYQSK